MNNNVNVVIIDDYRTNMTAELLKVHCLVHHQNSTFQYKIFDTLNDDSKLYIADIKNAVDMVIIEPFLDILKGDKSSVVKEHVDFICSVNHIPFLVYTTQDKSFSELYKTVNSEYLRKGVTSSDSLIKIVDQKIMNK